ncbi:MAG: hypothetical protein JW986_05095 [Methanotrichaceae archaeon]|nr:hypothetical protein [Methanotrichaceae archaeon]
MSCILFLTSVPPASAGFDVGGAICVQEVNPGQHIIHRMTVLMDKGGQPIDMEAKVWGRTQGLADELLLIDPAEDQSPFSAAPFLRVAPERLYIEPGVVQEILLEGDIPFDACPGTFIAAVQFKTIPVDNGAVAIASAVNVPIKLIVKSCNLSITGEIADINITGPEPTGNAIEVSFILNNIGNANYFPIANATLKDDLGNVLATELVEASNTLLPTYSRQFNLSLRPDGELGPGRYSVNVSAMTEDGIFLASEEMMIEV